MKSTPSSVKYAMGIKIFAVIDTNVLVSALFSIHGQSKPAIVIRKIIDGTITPLYNEEILTEYTDVLNRDKFPSGTLILNG